MQTVRDPVLDDDFKRSLLEANETARLKRRGWGPVLRFRCPRCADVRPPFRHPQYPIRPLCLLLLPECGLNPKGSLLTADTQESVGEVCGAARWECFLPGWVFRAPVFSLDCMHPDS